MKILVLGDIHGRLIWNDIIEKENPDKVIFLGDYVSTHEDIPADQQLSNLGYYWAECSGYDMDVAFGMSSSEFLMRFTKLTDWVYVDDELKTIFSHAGVSKVWMEKILKESDVHNINDYGLRKEFGFTPNWGGDYYGNSTTQPPTWIRPEMLCICNVEGWNQVVGHTPVRRSIIDIGKLSNIKESIWLCDALGINQYLVIEDGKFIPKSL